LDVESLQQSVEDLLSADLAPLELHVHKYYEPTAHERRHEASPVQNHVYQAHRSLKLALEELRRLSWGSWNFEVTAVPPARPLLVGA
jgi:hypothetical protein